MKAPRLLHLLVATMLLAPGVLLVAATRGNAAQGLGNYNGTVSGTALHVQAGSAAFPNFATGAVDNKYPLAAARLDSSPFANALSSPLDTGPLGQTAAASGQQNQPQYADVRCPPQCDDKPVVVGSAPGPFASSQAADQKALAEAKAGGVSSGGGAPAPPAPPAPPGGKEALRAALLAWRAQFLTLDDALRYPMPAADTPDGVSGDTARSEARLDGSTLVLDGTSSVGELVLGGGALVLRDVNVKVSVTNDGTPKKTVVINIGSALVGGTPVTIGADGVSVNGQMVPGIAEGAAQANAALNQALAKAGVEVRSLAPSEQLTDHQVSLDAVGVLIRFAPASPAPGVPANFTAMAVGEVFADSLAVPGDANGALDDGLGGASPDTGSLTSPSTETGAAGPTDLSSAAGESGSTSGSGDLTSGGSGSLTSGATGGASFSSGSSGSNTGSSGAALGSSGASTTAPAAGLAAPASARRLLGHEKPTKLLLLYLLWQSLVIGTVASLYLWRKAAA